VQRPPGGAAWVVVGGAVLPALVITAVWLLTVRSLGVLAGPTAPAALRIDVIGHDWWWEVRYPHHGFTTANEIHIPVGQPVQLVLTSTDVIHSFWVPQLQGKMDLTPGRVTTLWLRADSPGEYRGQCAEFCGVQHAKMAFLVIAQPPDQFDAWLDRQRQPASAPAAPLARQGEAVFLRSNCIECHTIAGTSATGARGPNLTHLASRRTLAAGTLANNRGNLGGWIVDPQALKPGNHMPPSRLSPADLHALLAYLESLE
jgi:cytochrome c oxidase subunit 2